MHRSQAEPAEAPPRVCAAIPARYDSTRLPGKALRLIAGVPMIERVYRRVERAEGLSRVVVLTDDERIARAVEGFGGEVEMTPADCASGTDRIAWAAKHWQVDAVVNVQGDEPLIDPAEIGRIARHLAKRPQDPVVTLVTPGTPAEAENPDVVKAVVDRRGFALYFSRAAIPHPRHADGYRVWCHVGIYGYQLATLLAIAAAERTPLERTESLEQLRLLENGIPIRALVTEQAWLGVDTMADLERVEALLGGGDAG